MTPDEYQSEALLLDRLFVAARREQPSAEIVERALLASSRAAASTGAGAAMGVGGASTVGIVKLLAVGGIVALGAVGVAMRVQPLAPERSTPARPSEGSAPATSAAPPVERPLEATPARRESAAVSAPATVAPPSRNPHSSSTSPEARRGPASALGEEVVLIDAARDQLQRGAYDAALSTLDRYLGRFAQGALAAEAAYLRMQVFKQRGDRQRAIDAARALVSDHADSAYYDEARDITVKNPRSKPSAAGMNGSGGDR